MGKIVMFILGAMLLGLSAVSAMKTREFVSTAHSIEGRVSNSWKGGKTVEFWIKHSDYQDPWADWQPIKKLQMPLEKPKKSKKSKGNPAEPVFAPSPDEFYPMNRPSPPPESAILRLTHTRYTFVTRNNLLGIDGRQVPVLYDPASLNKDEKSKHLEVKLSSSQVSVNTFSSLYFYSIAFFISGALIITGAFLAALKSRYMGLRYFREQKTATTDAKGWVKCPGCRSRFRPTDYNRWDYERHTSCGQKIKLTG